MNILFAFNLTLGEYGRLREAPNDAFQHPIVALPENIDVTTAARPAVPCKMLITPSSNAESRNSGDSMTDYMSAYLGRLTGGGEIWRHRWCFIRPYHGYDPEQAFDEFSRLPGAVVFPLVSIREKK